MSKGRECSGIDSPKPCSHSFNEFPLVIPCNGGTIRHYVGNAMTEEGVVQLGENWSPLPSLKLFSDQGFIGSNEVKPVSKVDELLDSDKAHITALVLFAEVEKTLRHRERR